MGVLCPRVDACPSPATENNVHTTHTTFPAINATKRMPSANPVCSLSALPAQTALTPCEPSQPAWAQADNPRLPGRYIQRLMRQHRITIRALATRMNITMKRVREVRQDGVNGRCMCLDWYEAITNTGLYGKA